MNPPVTIPSNVPTLTGCTRHPRPPANTEAPAKPSEPPSWAFIEASKMVARALAGAPLLTAEDHQQALDAFCATHPEMKGVAAIRAFHREFPEFAKCVAGTTATPNRPVRRT